MIPGISRKGAAVWEYIKRSIEEIVLKSDRTFKCVLVTGGKADRKINHDKKAVSEEEVCVFRRSVYGGAGAGTAGDVYDA